MWTSRLCVSAGRASRVEPQGPCSNRAKPQVCSKNAHGVCLTAVRHALVTGPPAALAAQLFVQLRAVNEAAAPVDYEGLAKTKCSRVSVPPRVRARGAASAGQPRQQCWTSMPLQRGLTGDTRPRGTWSAYARNTKLMQHDHSEHCTTPATGKLMLPYNTLPDGAWGRV